MKVSQRFIASTAMALIMGTACFGQRYTRINLVSSTAGVARVRDSQLIFHRRTAPWYWRVVWVFGGSLDGRPPRRCVAMVTSRSSGIHAHITSTPAGADIQVDGAYVGATPADIEVTCCWHDVTVIKPGRKPWTRRVRITNGHVTINVQITEMSYGILWKYRERKSPETKRCVRSTRRS